MISEEELHSNVLKAIATVGENAIQGGAPVIPPTQFPQLSIKAVPFGVLLQSRAKLLVINVSETDQEELPLIEEQ